MGPPWLPHSLYAKPCGPSRQWAVSRLPSGVIHETPQHLTAAGMAQFAERLGLNLSYPLARHVEVVTDLFQGMGGVDPDAKTLAQHPLFPRCERLQDLERLFFEVHANH